MLTFCVKMKMLFKPYLKTTKVLRYICRQCFCLDFFGDQISYTSLMLKFYIVERDSWECGGVLWFICPPLLPCNTDRAALLRGGWASCHCSAKIETEPENCLWGNTEEEVRRFHTTSFYASSFLYCLGGNIFPKTTIHDQKL